MGRLTETQTPVKLFFALMSGQDGLFPLCEELLTEEFGPVDLKDDPYPFDPMTDYYAGEFGKGLQKIFLSAKDLIPPDKLVEIKLRTNEMEEQLARERQPGEADPERIVNIDPGYLSHSKIVLATTKDHSHRLYVGRGVFEEVTLNYQRVPGRYQPRPWTYRDYRMEERAAFFNLMRTTYVEQLKQTP